MNLNDDLSQRVSMHARDMDWQASPGGEVERKRLHLVGQPESGQVTSIVRFSSGARFPSHDHPEGEEILVLDGVFSDERGDWPRGSYLLNPEGYRHAPYSLDGCLLFVKLRQYGGPGRGEVAVRLEDLDWCGSAPGVDTKWLYRDDRFGDSTCLERWQPRAVLPQRSFEGGAELFVLAGSFADGSERFDVGSWLRLPPGGSCRPHSEEGCVVYLKEGGVATLRDGASSENDE